MDSINVDRDPAQPVRRTEHDSSIRDGRAVFWVIVAAFALVSLPVILNGAPHADDYSYCVDGRKKGLIEHLSWIARFTGIVRPARFLETVMIGRLCERVPFSLLIVVPFALALSVGIALRHLLKDLELPFPWPSIGGAIWFLQPLGLEAALWPSALHVPLGLLLALVALRLVRRRRTALAAVAALLAYLCAEQLIFALPLAAWMVAPSSSRRGALLSTAGLAVLVVLAYQQWPGSAPRPPLDAIEAARNALRGPSFYVRFPATSLGVHSIPLSVAWAFPWSVALLAAGGAVGAFAGARLFAGPGGVEKNTRVAVIGGVVALAVLLNIPAAVTYPHPNSGRVFTPTWLLLAAAAAAAGAQASWLRPRVTGAIAGVLATGAVLSLALSAWVRVRTADISELSFRWIGSQVRHGGVVAICDIERAMVPYAPTGDFHTSEFLHIWLARAALEYHTGVTAEVRQGGRFWEGRCPDLRGADLVATPSGILSAARQAAGQQ